MLNGKIIIEIREAGFINKGAELMLYAVLDKLKRKFPDSEFAMAPTLSTGEAPYLKRSKLGLYQKPQMWRMGIQFGFLAKFIPYKIRDRFGLVLDSEVDIVIDAAGFAYTDKWGERSCEELADSCIRWNKNGTKVILLPQAFGPFNSKYNQKAIRTILLNSTLVYAREKISYNYLVEIVGELDNLKIAPDFTNLIKGIVPQKFDSQVNRFCIIPNYRMIDKTSKKEGEAYLPFMIEITRYAYTKGLNPFILIHEGIDDLELAEKIRDKIDINMPIIKESDPLKIKGIIGKSSFVVGSRFHGLVSALSQATPALAVGWSHKYKMLFEDYCFPEGLLDVSMSTSDLHQKMDLIISKTSRSKLIVNLQMRADKIKLDSMKMWDEVIDELEV